MYVSNIKIQNWRNFKNVDMPLSETVYLLGPNASGKSNFLDVFRFMRDIVNPKGGGLQQAMASRGGLDKVRCLAVRKTHSVEIEFELREDLDDTASAPDWSYMLSINDEAKGKRRIVVEREEVFKKGKRLLKRPSVEDKKDPERLTQTHIEQVNMNREFREIADFFGEVLYLHLVPQLLKFLVLSMSNRDESDPFGQGFLERVSRTTPQARKSRLKRIERILKSVIPHFQDLRFVKDEITGTPHLEMRYAHWRPSAGWQREDQFSDGTLRLIALMWTLLSSNSLVLLEEPELSLHNKIVEQIPDLFYQARKSRKKPGGQIFVSTHSESLLSSKSIEGKFLILKPGGKEESTLVLAPTEYDLAALQAGMSPADIIIPKTASTIGQVNS